VAARALRRHRRDERRVRSQLSGTTQNDIIKEYLSRGTYVFPPEPSMRLTTDIVAYTVAQIPKWNPINVCSYHLQEAGATPTQEIAFAMANAIAGARRRARARRRSASAIPEVVGRISFFLNAGIRFVEEICKARAMAELWDEITAERYGVDDPVLRRFRYGVQVNSLGLTEAQPENNVIRIVLEALGVTFSKKARWPRAPAAGLERGARPAAAVGPAVVAAQSSRSSPTRPTCSSTRICSTARTWWKKHHALIASARKSSRACRRWAARSRRRERVHEAAARGREYASGCARSRAASASWSA
jgi:hypothetical protein